MTNIPKALVEVCRTKLLETKSDILNRLNFSQDQHLTRDQNGDETDQAINALAESNFLITQKRMREQLVEIEYALARITSNNFGVCEETHELIEEKRLLSMPWTRLSIEGAEIREAISRKFIK